MDPDGQGEHDRPPDDRSGRVADALMLRRAAAQLLEAAALQQRLARTALAASHRARAAALLDRADLLDGDRQ